MHISRFPTILNMLNIYFGVAMVGAQWPSAAFPTVAVSASLSHLRPPKRQRQAGHES
jgi:hypothetical protein